MNTFGANVRAKRQKLGWSLEKLAKKANIAVTTLSGYELEKRDPNLFFALDIARALGCNIYDLCGIKEEDRDSR